MNKLKRKLKRQPGVDARAGLQGFIEFLAGGKGSPEERGAVQRHAERRLGPCAKFLIGIIEESGIPEDTQETALLNLRDALACAYMIGAENTATAIKHLPTADMRKAKDRHREPS